MIIGLHSSECIEREREREREREMYFFGKLLVQFSFILLLA